MSVTFTPSVAHDDAPMINMANGNAAAVLDLLGVVHDGDLCGEATAEDFLGRILLARALVNVATDDEHGTPDVVVDDASRADSMIPGGRHIYCGRRPGYLADRLAELHQLAEWARRHRAVIVWS